MNEHAEHRRRVRNRFLSEGLDSFEEHQIIELLLFYGIPRRDTNEVAHHLLNAFGSLRGVLDAGYEDLVKIPGVGENCACLIRFASALSRRYALSEPSSAEKFDTADKVGRYLVALFMGCPVEQVWAMFFNGRNELISCEKLCDGSVSSSSFSPRLLIEKAITNKAVGVVLAHNHPTGLAVPSRSDIEFTSQLEYLCSQIGVPITEHFVVAGNKFTPIMVNRPRY